jgi:hypothetical protein
LDGTIDFNSANKSMAEGLAGIAGTPGTLSDYAAQGTRGVLGFVQDGVMGIAELAYEGVKAVPKLGRMVFTSNGQV